MRPLLRVSLALWLASLGVLGAAATAAAAPPLTCTADLFIFTTSLDNVRTVGNVTIARDSGVAGSYTSGFPAGYQFTGTQDIIVNRTTNQAELHGSFTAVDPADASNTFTLRYTGQADLTTGAGTGTFVSQHGTGRYADFHWTGTISAQLVGPLTFTATDTGPCHPAP